MTDDGLGAAVARLEGAIARLEHASRVPRGEPALEQLQARHDRLRARVGEAVARLDALIAGNEEPA